MWRPRRTGCLLVLGVSVEQTSRLLEILGDLALAVEREANDPVRYYMDVTGVPSLYGGEPAWCRSVLTKTRAVGLRKVRLGLAGTRFAAWVAARTAPIPPGFQVIAQSDAQFLAPFPVDVLPLSGDTIHRLRILGLDTVGKVAELPPGAVAEQFGSEGMVAWYWARGQDNRPVAGQRPRTVSAEHFFDAPEARAEALLETAARLAERALQDLPVDRQVWAIRRVVLEAHTFEGKSVTVESWLGEPAGPETLRTALARIIARFSGESEGIISLSVSLVDIDLLPGKQLSFETLETDSQWRKTMRVIQHKYPHGLWQPAQGDPNAPILSERYLLRVLAL